MARARLVGAAMLGAALLLAPRPTHGQETGSDVHMPPPRIVVASASLALRAAAAAAPTAQAFAAAIQATVTQTLGAPQGETQARSQLGDFRTSILIKAGVLTFSGSERTPRSAESGVREKRPAWGTRPIVFFSGATRPALARR